MTADPSLPLVIVNPASASGNTRSAWARMASELRTHFGAFAVEFTSGRDDGRRLARESAGKGTKLIIACGGDGTISEVANGILESNEPAELGILPSGTGGDFRRTLKLPANTLGAARALKDGRSRLIDVGRVGFVNHGGKHENRFFVNVASFGLSPDVLKRSSAGDAGKWTAALGASTPVRVLNDAHAALLGEAWTGAAAGCAEVVLLTLGTGVGGAILSGGRLVLGATGRAGHWGHVSLDPDGPPSITGMPGSLEGAIGNYSLAARSEGRFTETRALVEAHLAGDAAATRVWRRSVRCLAVAIASIANAVDPERVVVGGGIARAGAALFDPLAAELDTVEWRPLGRRVRVLPAALGDLAGAIGAARAALGAAES